MGFDEAIKSGFANYANFKGRAIRSEYNYWLLFNFLIHIFTAMIDSSNGYTNTDNFFRNTPLNIITLVLFILPNCAITVRRLHDTNRSAWWLLYIIFAEALTRYSYYGVIAYFPFYYLLMLVEGDKSKNFYGTNILHVESATQEKNINLDDLSKLEKLAELKEKGHITEDEFNDKKKDLL